MNKWKQDIDVQIEIIYYDIYQCGEYDNSKLDNWKIDGYLCFFCLSDFFMVEIGCVGLLLVLVVGVFVGCGFFWIR